MAIPLNDNIEVIAPKPTDSRYFASSNIPWVSVAAVNAGINISKRYIGLTVNINNQEYWYKEGVTNNDLVLKMFTSFKEVTKIQLDQLITNNLLEVGTTYKITGVHPTLYNDGTNSGTTIYLQALTTNRLTKQGHGEFYNPKYNQATVGFGIWNNSGSWNAVLKNKSKTLGLTYAGPAAICMDLQGNVYTANLYAGNVSKITPQGVSSVFGTTGATPKAICVDIDGNVYTANTNSNNVSKITPAGVSTILGTTGWAPIGIVVDLQGNVYTANNLSNNVSKITPAGVSSIFAATGTNPRGICIDANQNIYTANRDSNNVSKITPSGVSTILGTTGTTPFDVTVDVDGNVYTSNQYSNNVTKITPLGVSTILGITGNGPVGISIDISGNIYTANEIDNNITKITPSGIATTLYISGKAPYDLVVNAASEVFVVNILSYSVYKIEQIQTQFNSDELITADNGATGQLIRLLSENIFIALTGNWAASKVINGNASGATAIISSIVIKSYTTGSKTIWGGYSWTNLNGNSGSSTDILSLNDNWSKNIYDQTNYNKVLDLIEYDYPNDWISRRYEVDANNNITYTKEDYNKFSNTLGLSRSAISVFMFGNKFSYSTGKGIKNNEVIDSYFECVNFYENGIYSNTLRDSVIRLFSSMPTGISLINNDLQKAIIDEDLFSSTVIYDNYPKTIYSRPDGTPKIRYYNDNDILVIADITD